jgi:H+/Cl- antiporter ClcA
LAKWVKRRMREKYRRNLNSVVAVLFSSIILLNAAYIFAKSHDTIFHYFSQMKGSAFSSAVSSLDTVYKNSVINRLSWINLFGTVQRILGKRIIGNYEYIKDEQGFIHYFFGGGIQEISSPRCKN